MIAVLCAGLVLGTLVPAGNSRSPLGADLPAARPVTGTDGTDTPWDEELALDEEPGDESAETDEWDDLEGWDDVDPAEESFDPDDPYGPYDDPNGEWDDPYGSGDEYWDDQGLSDDWYDDWGDDWYDGSDDDWWSDDEDPWAPTTTAPTTSTTSATAMTTTTSTTTAAPTVPTTAPSTTTTTAPPAPTGGWCDPTTAPRTSGEPVAIIDAGQCLRTEIVRPAAGQSLDDAVVAARRRPGVRSVGVPSTVRVSRSTTSTSAMTAPDPRRAEQWALDVLRAAELGPRPARPDVPVAVLDTGVDAGHPDLAGVVASGYDALGPGDGRIDRHGHGTLVAGVIGAVAGNGIGIAGFGGHARIVPVRVLGEDGTGSSLDVAAGVDWAVRNGARVIDLSLATTVADEHLRVAVERAVAAGVVVVAAAGNGGAAGNPASYPAAFAGVVAVAAVDQTLAPADFSTRGTYVALAAPGKDILSTWRGGGYARAGGTSFAAAHVAAGAAVLLADGADPATVRALLARSARDLGAPGTDPATGAGLLDLVAARRLVPAPSTTSPTTTSPTTSTTAAGPTTTVAPATTVPMSTATATTSPAGRNRQR